jgi:hypothetical protein
MGKSWPKNKTRRVLLRISRDLCFALAVRLHLPLVGLRTPVLSDYKTIALPSSATLAVLRVPRRTTTTTTTTTSPNTSPCVVVKLSVSLHQFMVNSLRFRFCFSLFFFRKSSFLRGTLSPSFVLTRFTAVRNEFLDCSSFLLVFRN